MLQNLTDTIVSRVAVVVERALLERSILRDVSPDEDLRDAGLSSLDMVNLVLSIEAGFNLCFDEEHITPKNFRSIVAISKLIGSFGHRA